MSGEFGLTTTGATDETLGAVKDLEVKGRKLKLKGRAILGGAAVLAAISIAALILYYRAEPAAAFSALDLPALKEKLDAAAGVASSAGDRALDSGVQAILGIMTGPIFKGIAIVAIVLSGVLSVFSESGMKFAMAGAFLVAPIFFLPTMLSVFGVETSSESLPIKIDNSGRQFPSQLEYLNQLVENKRYAELVKAVGDLMPAPQSAYVRAQVAYLEKKPEVVKVELGKIDGSTEGIKADHLAVMEKFAFGTPKSAAAVEYVKDAKARMDNRNAVHQSSGVFATILALVGGVILGAGLFIERRARRLKAMLGITVTDSQKDEEKAPQKELSAQALEDRSRSADRVPAWQRTSTPEPVASGGMDFLDGALIGAAAATIIGESVSHEDTPCDLGIGNSASDWGTCDSGDTEGSD